MLSQNSWGALTKGICISLSKKDIQVDMVEAPSILAFSRISLVYLVGDVDALGCVLNIYAKKEVKRFYIFDSKLIA